MKSDTEAKAFFENLFEQSPFPMSITDEKGTRIRQNQALRDQFGITDENTIGVYNVFKDNVLEDLGVLPLIRQVYEEGKTMTILTEYDAGKLKLPIPTNRQYRIIDTTFAPVRDQTGKIISVIFIQKDITERHRMEEKVRRLNAELEQRVRERTAQLEAANRELESFSYSVSHDLRAPLRSINSFSQILQDHLGKSIDKTDRDYFQRIFRNIKHMSELIEGLLTLSRLTRVPLKLQSVNLSELALEITRELQQQEPQHRAEILIEPELTVRGDPTLLQIVLNNLLRNAWKFTHKTESPRIEFRKQIMEGKPVFLVRDNGAGFDMNYADKLFKAFQRLHTEKDYEGTGIGLATVQRILQRHEGCIWAEGEVNKGATFYFTLETAIPPSTASDNAD
jgi:PAS domain S-box-containing protein